MQWDYVYADLQLQVTFDAEANSAFAHLTDTETVALQQIIYMALAEFQYVRALNARDIDALQKVIEKVQKRMDILESGG